MIYERVTPGEIKAVFRLSLSFDGRIIDNRSYDQHPFILLLGICEVPSVISRCQASNVRECPDLEEVDIGISISVFSITDSRSCRGHLDITVFENFNIAW